jgi:hypothetical protein
MKNLNTIREEVEAIRDELGKPVDPGIKELVIGLMANGITTDGSCEGHLKRKHPYPWVDVPYQEAEQVSHLVGMQNRPKLGDGSDNTNFWVIRPSGGLRIIPQNQSLPIEELQHMAEEFGLFLQHVFERDNQ